MKCELCCRPILTGDTAHGIRYGSVDQQHQLFIPDKDAAYMVICPTCGDMLCKLIYAKLNTINPTLYKTFTQTR
jgi:hypothetical protein